MTQSSIKQTDKEAGGVGEKPQASATLQICTANMCSEITVEMHLKNCNFEKLQFFTVDQCSLYFLQVKNCNFNTISM